MSYKLSICIPTYNRMNYLKKALDSIIMQLGENNDVEIVISDNASTDQTEELVNFYKKRINNINYYRQSKNIGADLNFLKVVELARGEYCWFLGSDDKLVDGALDLVLKEIDKNYEIYLCNRIECDKNYNKLVYRKWLKVNGEANKVYDLSNRKDLIKYLDSCYSIGALFSYLSSLIFKREIWCSINFDKSYIGTAYSHVYMLMSFLKNKCQLRYIEENIVYCLIGNDSFSNDGAISRLMLDVNGYLKIYNDFFYNDEIIYNKALQILEKRIGYKKVIKVSMLCNSVEWIELKNKLKKIKIRKSKILIASIVRKLKPIIKNTKYLK